MPTWNGLKDWLAGETLFDDDLLNYINANLDYRLKPPSFYVIDTGAYNTSSTSFVPVNALFTQAMLVNGGAILCGVQAHVTFSGGFPDLAIGIDGGNEQIILRKSSSVVDSVARGFALFTGLSPGMHTPTLRYRNASGLGNVFLRGADASGIAIPPIIFWGIEI